MTKTDAAVIAKALFNSYPSVNEFFITVDGNAFEHQHNADSHAYSLNSKTPEVIPITRQETEQQELADGDQGSSENQEPQFGNDATVTENNKVPSGNSEAVNEKLKKKK
jgi:hypothetical protein